MHPADTPAMGETTHDLETIAKHIRTQVARGAHASPVVGLPPEAWEAVLGVLTPDAAGAAAGGWRPIETTPRPADGPPKYVLLSNGRFVERGWWDEDEGGWVCGYDYGAALLIGWAPTHWQPLPAPPSGPESTEVRR